jgi:mycoredoxin
MFWLLPAVGVNPGHRVRLNPSSQLVFIGEPMADPKIIIYGSDWCGDCRRAKRFFNNNSIPYHWIDIEVDRQAEQYVLQVNRGMRSIPTILFEDGSLLVEPSTAELSRKMGMAVA